MLRALYSAASGMESQQTNLDVISNNLANVSTTGYKKSKAEFQDLLYSTSAAAGADAGGGNQLPTGVQIGHGSTLVSTSKVFTSGELQHTDDKLAVAIEGDGFFEVQMTDGTKAYTRDGAWKLDKDGRVVTDNGLVVQPGITIPQGASDITISGSGEVSVKVGTATQKFNIQLTRFVNPAGLQSLGHNLFKETDASGTAEVGTPGENGFGSIQQYYLEMSNVKVVEEMVNLIVAQRAYEVNSKAVQAADEMLQLSNNMRR